MGWQACVYRVHAHAQARVHGQLGAPHLVSCNVCLEPQTDVSPDTLAEDIESQVIPNTCNLAAPQRGQQVSIKAISEDRHHQHSTQEPRLQG